MKPTAVILLSGGLDSCVTCAAAQNEFEPALLHLDYGQRTAAKERECFEAIADYYQVPPERRLLVRTDLLEQIGGSSLTDRGQPVEAADLSRPDIPRTYVPFRNSHLLAAGVSWAEVLGARPVFLGATEVDGSGYPDCRGEYFDAFQKVVAEGTRPESQIAIRTPLLGLAKGEIVRRGLELNAPLDRTWSCYLRTDLACGRCDSCAWRLKGFADAGATDPIPYATGA